MSHIITKISIVNNTRFLNKGVREIHYEPDAKQQIIIGRNGYGKSTLLSELNGLPGEVGSYIQGGYKLVEIKKLDENVSYRIESKYSKSGSYSFIKIDSEGNETELNQGGTLGIQKELAKTHLGDTASMRDTMLSITPFTGLNNQERRHYFIGLCNVDVTYAMRVYKILQTNLRNTTGAKKHEISQLAKYKSNLISSDELNRITTNIEHINSELKELYAIKKSNPHFTLHDQETLDSINDRIITLSRKTIEIINRDETIGFDRESFFLHEHVLKEKMIVAETELTALKRSYDSMNDIIRLIKQDNEIPLDQIKNEYRLLNEERNSIKEIIFNLEDEWNLNQLSLVELRRYDIGLTNLDSQLDIILATLPINTDFSDYNRETMEKANQELISIQKEIDQLLYKSDKINNRIEDIENAKTMTCPSCSYTWLPGISENELEKIKVYSTKIYDKIKLLETSKNDLIRFQELANEWKDAFMSYSSLARQYSSLSILFNKCLDDMTIYNRPKTLIGLSQSLHSDVKTFINFLEKDEECKKLEEVITLREASSRPNDDAIIMISNLEKSIVTATDYFDVCKKEYLDFKVRVDKIVLIEKNIEELKRLMTQFEKLEIKKDQQNKYNKSEKLIKDTQIELSRFAAEENRYKSDVEIIKHIENNLIELDNKIIDYNKALDLLSPTNGLIAESLMGFMDMFIEEVNDVIRSVWTTQLIVLPCENKEGELNYLFPVISEDSDYPAKDVSKCSVGEKEIINFAFTIVERRYRGLIGTPAVFDEVGRTFYEDCQVRVFDYIKRLVDTQEISQAFIVSHFKSMYDSLTHADVNAIDPTGVLITADINKNFKVI